MTQHPTKPNIPARLFLLPPLAAAAAATAWLTSGATSMVAGIAAIVAGAAFPAAMLRIALRRPS